jgi:hypothetical protein
MNYKIVKCEMVVLTEREKTEVADVNVTVD